MSNIDLIGKLIYGDIEKAGYTCITGTIALDAVIKEAIRNLSLSVNDNDLVAIRAAVLKMMQVEGGETPTSHEYDCCECDGCEECDDCDCDDDEDEDEEIDENLDDICDCYYDLDAFADECIDIVGGDYAASILDNMNEACDRIISSGDYSDDLISKVKAVKSRITSTGSIIALFNHEMQAVSKTVGELGKALNIT